MSDDDLNRRPGHQPLLWFHRGSKPKAAVFPDDIPASAIDPDALSAALAALGVLAADPADLDVGATARVMLAFTNPSWAQTLAERPELLAMGWSALTDYSVAQGQSSPCSNQ